MLSTRLTPGLATRVASGLATRVASGMAPGLATMLALGLIAALLLPIAALLLSASPADLMAGVRHPSFGPALWLSARTTATSLAIVVVTGAPLAWWLATSSSRWARAVDIVVDLPIVIPPAVVGVALLQTFGRRGLLGSTFESLGIALPFTPAAVVLAQVVVAAPFFVQAAANAFRKVDRDLLIVARTLGASPAAAFFRVTVPVALPGLVAGASLAWARALGEFGATLIFAGNLRGSTQTMPLAIFSALESDLRVALVFSLVLGALGVLLLVALRLAPALWARLATGGRS